MKMILLGTLVLVLTLLAAPQPTRADTIAIAGATNCSGLGPGGTICSGTGTTPFNITAIESGSVVLNAVVGTNTSPVYEIINNTTSTITSLTLLFNGTLGAGQSLNCQSGGFPGASCSMIPNNLSTLSQARNST